MKKWILCFFYCSMNLICMAQMNLDTIDVSPKNDSIIQKTNIVFLKDSFSNTVIPVKNYLSETTRKKRIKWVATANITGYTGALAGLYTFWYRDYPQSRFHFFNDNKENLQVDKVSHAYGAYFEGRLSIAMWRWAGLSDRKAILIGGLSGLAYEGIIETLDGFSSQWGWSWGDIGGNAAGTSILLAQELGWKEQRITFKYSTHINHYNADSLKRRMDDLSGTSFPRRLLEDYNAQTYWLSFNLKTFFKNSNLPPWLNVAAGYGANGMFGPAWNKWYDKTLNKHYDASNIERYRQWYIAPDVDFTRIKTKNTFLKYAFVALNCLKFPTPSIEFSQNKVKWNWFHF